MATVYPDIRIVEEVYKFLNVVWNISIFIVPFVCMNRYVRHKSNDAFTTDRHKVVNIRNKGYEHDYLHELNTDGRGKCLSIVCSGIRIK
jgi:hypothetical protein